VIYRGSAMASRAARTVLFGLLLTACASVPPPIRDELAATPSGQATVIFFTDFECPFCRRTHAAFEPALVARRKDVRVVFRHVPLDRHPFARTAARAAICAERELPAERAFDYAAALFKADDLSEQACSELAVKLGADRGKFHACVESPSTDERLEADMTLFDEIGGDGVPLLFVGRERFEGAQSRLTLETSLRHALSRAGAK
jgi:protein-disulfide isomerase